MSKIHPLHTWDSHAALYSAIEETHPDDKVLILIEHSDGSSEMRSANLTNADSLFMMEKRKVDMFL